MSINFKITFLGTCACDYSRKLKYSCRDKFDLDARRSSAMMIGDKYLIDCGHHGADSLRIANVDTRKITDIFISHLHPDHYNRESIAMIARDHEVRLWVREDAKVAPIENVTVVRMNPYEKYEVRSGLFVTGIEANHDPHTFPQHFIFEKRSKRILIGGDGGWFLNPAFKFLRKKKLALAVLDCTVGDYDGDFRIGEHNSIPMIRLLLPSLKTIRATTDKTKIYLTHLAPSLHKPHAETVEIARELGAQVAYDGLKIEI